MASDSSDEMAAPLQPSAHEVNNRLDAVEVATDIATSRPAVNVPISFFAGSRMRETHSTGPDDFCSFSFMHANVQGISSKSAVIARLVERCHRPEFLGSQKHF